MAISATRSSGTLSLLGDTLDNIITADRDAAGDGVVAGAAGTPDRIDLRAFANAGIHGFNDVLAHATQIGADTLIDFGDSDALLLENLTKSDLSVDDVLFGPPPDTTPPQRAGCSCAG
jgi:hypothetical protein